MGRKVSLGGPIPYEVLTKNWGEQGKQGQLTNGKREKPELTGRRILTGASF